MDDVCSDVPFEITSQSMNQTMKRSMLSYRHHRLTIIPSSLASPRPCIVTGLIVNGAPVQTPPSTVIPTCIFLPYTTLLVAVGIAGCTASDGAWFFFVNVLQSAMTALSREEPAPGGSRPTNKRSVYRALRMQHVDTTRRSHVVACGRPTHQSSLTGREEASDDT